MKNILFFTVHKAASVFIHQICSDLSHYAGIEHYSPNHPLDSPLYFPEDFKIINDYNYWKNRNGCIGPLRYFNDILYNTENTSILHLRDPRDGLTSMYYSFVYSHPRKRGFNPSDYEVENWIEGGIDKFVMQRAPEFLNRYTKYCDELFDKENVIIVKYEDMVYDYKKWLQQIILPFNFKNETAIIEALYNKYNDSFKVKKEDKFKHVRKVTPGDHKIKLRKDTINTLNQMFDNVLTKLEYL